MKIANINSLPLTEANIKTLATDETSGRKISLYFPVASPGAGLPANATHLENLLNEAETQLIASGEMEVSALRSFTSPLHLLLEHPDELIGSGKSLALFLNQEGLQRVDLPDIVEPQQFTGKNFTIKPLLSGERSNCSFTVVCLNLGAVKVYAGDFTGIEAIDVKDMPESIEEFTRFDDPEKSLQRHTSGRTSAEGAPGTVASSQTHGQGLPADFDETQNERFFKAIANCLKAHLVGDEKSPLLLFGVDKNVGYLSSHYGDAHHPIIVKHSDPHTWSVRDILTESLRLLETEHADSPGESVSLFSQAIGRGEAVCGVEACALAAAAGRISDVVIASDQAVPGYCDPDKLEVRFLAGGSTSEDVDVVDLLDCIAEEVLKYGGHVRAVPTAELPGEDLAVALVRA
ncbi:baeRF3 domain-containing protein [Coraliomargarita sp. W4R72]